DRRGRRRPGSGQATNPGEVPVPPRTNHRRGPGAARGNEPTQPLVRLVAAGKRRRRETTRGTDRPGEPATDRQPADRQRTGRAQRVDETQVPRGEPDEGDAAGHRGAEEVPAGTGGVETGVVCCKGLPSGQGCDSDPTRLRFLPNFIASARD